MKKLQILGRAAIFCFAMAVATACGSDDGGSSTGGNSGSYIEAKVDGTNFKAEVMGQSTVVALKLGVGDQRMIQLSGADASANAMNIIVYGVTGPGTYEIGPDSDSVLSYFQSPNQSYDTGECSGATGTVIITELTDEKVKGTFSFTGKVEESGCASKSVTQGKFQGIFMDM